MANTILIVCFVNTRFFSIALPPSFCRRCPLRIFGTVFFRYCTKLVHRGKCKKTAVYGFGGWSVGLIAPLTNLGGGWERDKLHRTAKLYVNDSHGKYVA